MDNGLFFNCLLQQYDSRSIDEVLAAVGGCSVRRLEDIFRYQGF